MILTCLRSSCFSLIPHEANKCFVFVRPTPKLQLFLSNSFYEQQFPSYRSRFQKSAPNKPSMLSDNQNTFCVLLINPPPPQEQNLHPSSSTGCINNFQCYRLTFKTTLTWLRWACDFVLHTNKDTQVRGQFSKWCAELPPNGLHISDQKGLYVIL